MKTIISLIAGMGLVATLFSQSHPRDSVVVQLAKTTTLTLTVEDRSDLELLEHYDFQALFADIIDRLQERETDGEARENIVIDELIEDIGVEGQMRDVDEYELEDDEDTDDEDADDEDTDDEEVEFEDYKNHHWHRFRHFFNFDLGMNNYLENSRFPDADGAQYAVRPWGSWYVALSSLYRIKTSDKFSIELGGGISWYNFKFQDEETLLTRTGGNVVFEKDERDFVFDKSKLTVGYLNLSVVPVFEFGSPMVRDNCWKYHHQRMFRVGAGLYGGYRITSYTKQVYDTGERDQKVRDHDSFYLNNLRYGIRVQLGIHETDIFFNYDLNPLFQEGRGPELNAYSFGFIF